MYLSMSDLLIQLNDAYPELYQYIFRKHTNKHISNGHQPLRMFIIQQNLRKTITFNGLWDYIVENEDKHNWWML